MRGVSPPMGSFALRSSILVVLLAAFGSGLQRGIRFDPAKETAAEMPGRESAKSAPIGADNAAVRERASAIFGTLPVDDENPANPFTEEKVKLGRMLYFDQRLSKSHDDLVQQLPPARSLRRRQRAHLARPQGAARRHATPPPSTTRRSTSRSSGTVARGRRGAGGRAPCSTRSRWRCRRGRRCSKC